MLIWPVRAQDRDLIFPMPLWSWQDQVIAWISLCGVNNLLRRALQRRGQKGWVGVSNWCSCLQSWRGCCMLRRRESSTGGWTLGAWPTEGQSSSGLLSQMDMKEKQTSKIMMPNLSLISLKGLIGVIHCPWWVTSTAKMMEAVSHRQCCVTNRDSSRDASL